MTRSLFVLFRVVDRAALTDDMYLYLSGILELALDPFNDVVRHEHHGIVIYHLGLDHYADLASCLDRVRFFDAVEVVGDLFEFREPLDVVLEIFSACARAGRRNGVGRLNDERRERLGFHVAVVRFDRVDDLFALFMLTRHLDAELNVRTLDLLRQCLADIVEQTRSLGEHAVRADLVGEDAGEQGDLDGVLEDVLTVARSVFQSAEEFYHLGRETVNARLERRFFTGLFDRGVNFFARAFDHLFYPCGMDTAVLDQFFERDPRDLAADRVEAGDRDRLGSVVDDEIDADQSFDRADIAAQLVNTQLP